MMQVWEFLIALFAALSLGHLIALGLGSRRWSAATKPFLMPALMASLLVAAASGGVAVNWLIVAGLGCGFLGDVLLLRRGSEAAFLAGLAAFLVGHLLYLVAFLPGMRAGGAQPLLLLVLLPLALYGGWYLRFLKAGMGRLLPAVAIYVGVISLMGAAALLRASALCGRAWLVAVGAGTFILSDSLLGIGVFRRSSRGVDVAVMASYLLAQFLISENMFG